MKNVFLTLQALVFGLAFTGMTFANGGVETYTVDLSQSTIGWKGYKVTGQHRGSVGIKSGNLQFTEGILQGGSFMMDMTSISNQDLSGHNKAKLEGHLKSDDFFGVEQHPVASFVITRAIALNSSGDYKIVGNLTIKNITKEIKFNANVQENGGSYIAQGDIKIDRSEFDVRYGSGSFFDNLGDKTIYDEFDIQVKLVVNKEKG